MMIQINNLHTKRLILPDLRALWEIVPNQYVMINLKDGGAMLEIQM